ncbi:DUF817 domain-containing protein [Patescibacteria group bacterium]|nr:DUF817 domain-containing protein [Patescibacteria group bacterium]
MRKNRFCTEALTFISKQARACIFAGAFFALLFLSSHLPLGPLPRYDFLFIAALCIQIVLIAWRIETIAEVKTIALFHLTGLVMELYKTHPSIGSWSYPEANLFRIATVPLFSGFMYAAVGSYISQAWDIFHLRLRGVFSWWSSSVLALAIYANFFTNHFLPDMRLFLIPLVFWVFRKGTVEFTVTDRIRHMPLPLSFLLIAFFIWIAENISTYFGAWKYPSQYAAWNMVSLHKISSWFLLVIISFILVAHLKRKTPKK